MGRDAGIHQRVYTLAEADAGSTIFPLLLDGNVVVTPEVRSLAQVKPSSPGDMYDAAAWPPLRVFIPTRKPAIHSPVAARQKDRQILK
jgi:hypothetical protein